MKKLSKKFIQELSLSDDFMLLVYVPGTQNYVVSVRAISFFEVFEDLYNNKEYEIRYTHQHFNAYYDEENDIIEDSFDKFDFYYHYNNKFNFFGSTIINSF